MTSRRVILVLIALAGVLALPTVVVADDDDEDGGKKGGGPVAVAVTFGAIGHDRAEVRGTVERGSKSGSWWFEHGPSVLEVSSTPQQPVSAGSGTLPVAVTLTGLKPEKTYYVRLRAGNSASAIKSFTTTPAPAGKPPAPPSEQPPAGDDDPAPTPTPAPGTGEEPAPAKPAPAKPSTDKRPEPEVGETVVAAPADGAIRVRLPGTDQFVELGAADAIPVGSVVDATSGSVKLAAGLDEAGRIQTGVFGGSRFLVRQRADGYVDLHLRGGSFAGCQTRGARVLAAATARKRKRVRDLWGSDKGGRFRTHGRDSVATVRGTEWSMTDRCDGTLTKVREGAVDVRIRRSGRVVRVRAGERHLARHVR